MEENYYQTKESVEEYIKAAQDFNGALLIEKLKALLEKNSVVLEIGSGPGTDWKILNEYFTVVGSDFSTEFLKHLMAEHPEGDFLELDAATLKTDKRFHAIYSNKVLHHLSDDQLIESIQRQYDILHTNGIICHSFWKGEGSEIFKGLFVNYHTETTLKHAFLNHFEILSLEEYQEFEENDSLLLIARKL